MERYWESERQMPCIYAHIPAPVTSNSKQKIMHLCAHPGTRHKQFQAKDPLGASNGAKVKGQKPRAGVTLREADIEDAAVKQAISLMCIVRHENKRYT